MTTYTLEQQKEHRKLWVDALRSGKYRQGQDVLRCADHFCCLGVLADIAGCEWDDNEWADGEEANAPEKAMAYVGLRTAGGSYGNLDRLALWSMNDSGKTFAQIADIIESEPEGLFIESQTP